MEEFLVHFEITVPPGEKPWDISRMYADEAKAAEPLIKAGFFRRVWREPGSLNHWALWVAPNADFIHLAYGSFPFFQANMGRATVHPLAVNTNDPGWPGDTPTEDEARLWANWLRLRQGPATPPRQRMPTDGPTALPGENAEQVM